MASRERPEDRARPWVKRRRVSGRIGEGWEKISLEKETRLKSPEVQKIGDRSIDLGAKKYQTFKDIDRKQVSISKFVVALEKKEEEIKERPPNLKPKPLTPIRTKIRRFEEKANSPGVSRKYCSIVLDLAKYWRVQFVKFQSMVVDIQKLNILC